MPGPFTKHTTTGCAPTIPVNIYEVHTISFQTFFVWAFKIVVDSWRFSMLFLYIIWDDWPIFIISGSNEAGFGIHPTKAWLKWWISKMVNFKNEKSLETYHMHLVYIQVFVCVFVCVCIWAAFLHWYIFDWTL